MTTSVVTRLTDFDDDVGWLTIQPRFHSTAYRGFDVFIPAGSGAGAERPKCSCQGTAPAACEIPDLNCTTAAVRPATRTRVSGCRSAATRSSSE